MRVSILLPHYLWWFSHRQKPIDKIPFEVVNGHIKIPLTINGGPELNMVFDTGAGANLLGEASANKLGIEVSGSTNVQGAAGSSNMKMTNPLSFKIGKTEIPNQQFVVMDISHLGEEGASVDAVLGASVLSQFIVEIDYDNQFLMLYENGKGPDTEGWQEVSVDLMPFNLQMTLILAKRQNH